MASNPDSFDLYSSSSSSSSSSSDPLPNVKKGRQRRGPKQEKRPVCASDSTCETEGCSLFHPSRSGSRGHKQEKRPVCASDPNCETEGCPLFHPSRSGSRGPKQEKRPVCASDSTCETEGCPLFHPSRSGSRGPKQEKRPVCASDSNCETKGCPLFHPSRSGSRGPKQEKRPVCASDSNCETEGCPLFHPSRSGSRGPKQEKRPVCASDPNCETKGCPLFHPSRSGSRGPKQEKRPVCASDPNCETEGCPLFHPSRKADRTQKSSSSSSSSSSSKSDRRPFPKNPTQKEIDELKARNEKTLEQHKEKVKKVQKMIDELPMTTRGESPVQRNEKYKTLRVKLDELVECERVFLNVHTRTVYATSLNRNYYDWRERDRRMFENALPAYIQKSRILDTLLTNKVYIVVGETGSGKSTQVPQYLADSKVLRKLQEKKGMSILCTQPRPIAATSLAKRVAQEYVISKNDHGAVCAAVSPKKTAEEKRARLVFSTNTQLLNRLDRDPKLSKYSCVVIDEAHERSLEGDILMNFLKKLTVERDDFYLVITSATINEEMFQDYFGNCPVVTISGRLHPVVITYNDNVINERYTDPKVYRRLAIDKVTEIMRSGDNRLNHGDVLVFLPSQEDCEKVRTELMRCYFKNVELITLHGNSSDEDKDKAMGPIPGKRKVIISTNIAETSLTINGVVHVIDSGLAKEIRYDPKKNMESLELRMITKSSAKQRAGRAGRTQPGMCHRLYSNEIHKEMQDFPVAEIKRKHLAKSLLLIMSRGVENVYDFEFIERPDPEAVDEALSLLRMMNALSPLNTLTPLGRAMAAMPTDPMISRFILEAASNGIANAAIQLGAMILCSDKIFRTSKREDESSSKIQISRSSFEENGGDLSNLLSIFRTFLRLKPGEKKDWVAESSLNTFALREAVKEARNIQESLQRALKYIPGVSMPPKAYDQEHEALDAATHLELRRAVCAGFFQNVAQLHDNVYNIVRLKQRADLHSHRSFPYTLDHKPEWIVYVVLFSSAKNKDYVLKVSEIDRSWITELAPEFSRTIDLYNLPSLIQFHEIISSRTASMIIGPSGSNRFELQSKWNCTFSFSDDRVTVTVVDSEAPRVRQELREIIKRYEDEIANEVEIRNIMNARCVVGKGGKILSILRPEEFIKVNIRGIPANVVHHELKSEIELFAGKNTVSKLSLIRNNKDKKSLSSAIVTFTNTKVAENVKENLAVLSGSEVKIKPFIEDRRISHQDSEGRHALHAKWTTVYRPPKVCSGTAKVVFLGSPPTEISNKQINIAGSLIKIRRVKPDAQHIKLFDLPSYTTKEHIENAIRAITWKPIQEVKVYYEKGPGFIVPPPSSDEDLAYTVTLIRSVFHAFGEFVDTPIIEQKPGFFYTIVLYHREEDAVRALTGLNGRQGVLGNGTLKLRYDPKRTITLPHTDLVKFLSSDIEALTVEIQRMFTVEVFISKQRDLIEFKKKIDATGNLHRAWNQIDAAMSHFREVLLHPRFVNQIFENKFAKLKEIMTATNTYIHLDSRRRIYSIYGKKENTALAEERLNKLQFRGDDVIVERFFNVTSTFQNAFKSFKLPAHLEANSPSFIHSPKRLTVKCRAVDLQPLTELIHQFRRDHSGQRNEGDVECQFCFSALLGVHSGSFLSCKHFVCDECLPNSLKSGCFNCFCGSEFAFTDIFLAKYFDTKPEELAIVEKKMLDSFIIANNSTYGYCDECRDGIWVSRESDMRCLNHVCQAVICKLCKKVGGADHPCEVLDFDVILRANPDTYRKCPNQACNKLVERSSGCNGIKCSYCKANFCWLCLRVFPGDPHAHFGDPQDPCYQKCFFGTR